jgi:hypothetical protein
MARGKPRIPPPRQKSRELLNSAETAATATSFEQPPEPISRRKRGERVDTPTAEMRGAPPTDWSKVGVWVAIATFSIGLLITVVWNYADTMNSIKNLTSDVGDLKKRADDLFRSAVDTSARLSNLERRAQLETSPSNQASSTTALKQRDAQPIIPPDLAHKAAQGR